MARRSLEDVACYTNKPADQQLPKHASRMALIRISLLCALASALVPRRFVAQRHVMRMAAESCEFTLKGDTVATAFFANQCRREMTQFRGLAGSIKPGAEPKTVCIVAEGERKKLESFVGWCQRGPPDLALEGGKPQIVGDVAYGAARNMQGFACDDSLCDVDMVEAAAAEGPARALLERDDDEITEEDLIAGLIDELS